MTGEKTEKPTLNKRREAANEGEVVKSTDLNNRFVIAAGLFINDVPVGFLFTPKAVLPKYVKTFIPKGFKRIFPIERLKERIVALMKVVLIEWMGAGGGSFYEQSVQSIDCADHFCGYG